MESYVWNPNRIKYFIVSNSSYEKKMSNGRNVKFRKFSHLDEAGRDLDEDIWCLAEVVTTIKSTSDHIELIFTKEYQDVEKLYNRLSPKDGLDCLLDGVVFVFLTYLGDAIDGEESLRIGGNSVSVNEIVDKVREDQTWHGKPKLFIIQADDTALMPEDTKTKGEPLPPREVKTIPFDADCLMLKSTIPQKWAAELCKTKKGPSFLIKAFCDEILENAQKRDLLVLTPNINRRVKEMIKNCSEELDAKPIKKETLGKMKYPECTSTLTRQLVFLPIPTQESGDGL